VCFQLQRYNKLALFPNHILIFVTLRKKMLNIPIERFGNLSHFETITHFVSTRQGGASIGEAEGLNIGFRTSDSPENVLQNREMLAQAVQISLDNFCVPQQTHSSRVALAAGKDKGLGARTWDTGIADTDALITQTPEVCLTVLSADCTLLLLYDVENQAIGAVHSGWRGTVGKIALRTLEAMQASFDTNPAQVWVGIAPCISAQVYEIGEDVIEATQKAFGTTESYLAYQPTTGRWHFDLRYANTQMLLEAGIPNSQIEISPTCTYSNPHLYYSARLTQGKTGRFGAGIMLKP
jgi:YfiH family protein